MAAIAFAETANLAVKLTLGGNFTSQMSKARASLRGFDKDASRAYKAGGQIGTGIKRSLAIGAAAASGFAVILAKSVDAAGDFEASLNTINTIARATPAALGKIGDAVRKIAKDTGTPLEDLTQGYYDLLSAGIKAADAQDVLTQSNKLAIGGLSTTAEAIDLLTTAINTYGGDASQAAKDADIFAKAVERGKVTAADIAGSFATIGPLAAAYGISIDEIGAAYARLTASGVPAAEAATQMRSAIQSLAKPDKALRKLEGITKKNYLGIAGKQGLVVALQMMRTDAEKAGIPLSLLTSRIEAMQFLLQTTGPNLAAYQADLKAMGEASGTAAEQMAERQKGLNFQLARLKALAKDAGITIGSALLPKLTPVVAKLNELINANQDKISAFGDQLAAAFTPEGIVDGIKSISAALTPMIELLRIAAAPVKAIVDAFLKLPKEVQTVLVGAFAVNKLTGGLVTNAAGGLVEALGKAVIGGIKAPLVNVQGGVVNVGGGIPLAGGGGIPLAGGGGGLGGAAGAAGIGAAAGLGIAGAVTLGGLFAAVNSPLWVKNTTLNTTNENAGLTQAERAAQTYYTASAADQAQMRKHILVLPTLADFQSGSIKLGTMSTGKTGSGYLGSEIRNLSKGITPPSKAAQKAAEKSAKSAALAAAAARSAASASMRRDAAPAVTTNVKTIVNVTANGITKIITTQSHYGPAGGSASDPRHIGYIPGGA